jgi:hypothetical protein
VDDERKGEKRKKEGGKERKNRGRVSKERVRKGREREREREREYASPAALPSGTRTSSPSLLLQLFWQIQQVPILLVWFRGSPRVFRQTAHIICGLCIVSWCGEEYQCE